MHRFRIRWGSHDGWGALETARDLQVGEQFDRNWVVAERRSEPDRPDLDGSLVLRSVVLQNRSTVWLTLDGAMIQATGDGTRHRVALTPTEADEIGRRLIDAAREARDGSNRPAA